MYARLLLVVLVAVTTGCATFELEGAGAITPDAVTNSQTVHGSLYGFRWQPHVTEKCAGDSLFRVEYHTNAAFLLVSVATLGLYVPQTVEWWCYAPGDEDEDEEAWSPGS